MTTTTGICPSPCSVFFFFCCWLIGGGGRGSSSTLSAPLLLLLLQMVVWTMLFTRIPLTDALYCYECTSSGRGDRTCNRYVGTSCGYGFFGCIKIGMYSGGVNKMGNFIDDDRFVVSMVRGCNLLPIGGVDACQQQVIFGMRIITCYCYSDYCNSSPKIRNNMFFNVFSLCLVILVYIFFL